VEVQQRQHVTAAVAPLQQLTWLQLDVQFKDVQALAQLSELEALQDLSLSYEDGENTAITAAVTAAAWPQLSALRSLTVDCERPHPVAGRWLRCWQVWQQPPALST
jgi:hypothetical protein